jgi:hypothetical protein
VASAIVAIEQEARCAFEEGDDRGPDLSVKMRIAFEDGNDSVPHPLQNSVASALRSDQGGPSFPMSVSASSSKRAREVESRMRGNTHVRFGGAGRGNRPTETVDTAPRPDPYQERLYK